MKNAIAVIFLLGAVAIFCPAIASDVPESKDQSYVSAKVYFFTWHFMSADSVRTAQDTREGYNELIVMNDELTLRHFTKWLELGKLAEGPSVNMRNTLLVIDLARADGHVDSFYSDGCLLFSSDFKRSRAVDESFRKQFDFVGGNVQMHTRTRDYHFCEKTD